MQSTKQRGRKRRVDRASRAAENVCRQLAEHTGTNASDWFVVFKARYGMQVVFDELKRRRGPGDVLTQIFTCATAVDPVLAAGLRPRYADVSPDTIAIDPAVVSSDSNTLAVVAQHTFGIVDDQATGRLRELADGAGALLIEDACHGLAQMARRADGTPTADVSVHSFGVEKMLPTRFGGAIWINPNLRERRLRERMVEALHRLPAPAAKVDLAARLYKNQVRVLNRLPGSAAGPLRNALIRVGAFEPPISPAETRGELPYEPSRPTAWMLDGVAQQLPLLSQNRAHREAAVAEYVSVLRGHVQIPAAIGQSAPLVRFPFFAPDTGSAEVVFDALTQAGHYPGRWYRPALFPGVADPLAYGYRPGDTALAVSEDLIDRVVNLPTTVEPDTARAIAELVRSRIGAAGPRT